MIKHKQIKFDGVALEIDYEAEDGEIVAICIDDIDITWWLRDSVIFAINEALDRSFEDDIT